MQILSARNLFEIQEHEICLAFNITHWDAQIRRLGTRILPRNTLTFFLYNVGKIFIQPDSHFGKYIFIKTLEIFWKFWNQENSPTTTLNHYLPWKMRYYKISCFVASFSVLHFPMSKLINHFLVMNMLSSWILGCSSSKLRATLN